MRYPLRALLALAVTPLALVACAPAQEATSTGSGSSSSGVASSAMSATGSSAAGAGTASGTALGGECAADKLTVRSPGKFTVGTDNPAYPPWFVDNKPANGQGFESAVAYAVAAKLGFTSDKVAWTTAAFNAAIAPGAKPFDIDINQISITTERKQAVDFSSGYYDVTQALVTIKGSKIAGATSIAALKSAKLGGQVGTTSLNTITNVIAPADKPAVFNTNDDAKLALQNGQIDGLVVDLPTALYLAAADLKDGVIVGQFENSGSAAEQFGLVLDKGSSLTPCVTKAVDALRADGTLAALQKQWLTDSAGAPVLK